MCVFCSIVSGDIPSSKVYEDDKYLAILDLSQTTIGHTLVMPKKHYSNILEMTPEEVGDLMKTARTVGEKVVNKLNAGGLNVLINTNEVAGQTVMHTHVHLIPRYSPNDTVEFKFSENKVDLNKVLNDLKD